MENMGGSPGDSSVAAAVPAGRDDSGEAARSAAPLKSGSPRTETPRESLMAKVPWATERRVDAVLAALAADGWEITRAWTCDCPWVTKYCDEYHR